jgi:hypothetical protein
VRPDPVAQRRRSKFRRAVQNALRSRNPVKSLRSVLEECARNHGQDFVRDEWKRWGKEDANASARQQRRQRAVAEKGGR